LPESCSDNLSVGSVGDYPSNSKPAMFTRFSRDSGLAARFFGPYDQVQCLCTMASFAKDRALDMISSVLSI
jgi:hypothetical protein